MIGIDEICRGRPVGLGCERAAICSPDGSLFARRFAVRPTVRCSLEGAPRSGGARFQSVCSEVATCNDAGPALSRPLRILDRQPPAELLSAVEPAAMPFSVRSFGILVHGLPGGGHDGWQPYRCGPSVPSRGQKLRSRSTAARNRSRSGKMKTLSSSSRRERCILRPNVWRWGRDSNPRYPYGHSGFRDRCVQPGSATPPLTRSLDGDRRSDISIFPYHPGSGTFRAAGVFAGSSQPPIRPVRPDV